VWTSGGPGAEAASDYLSTTGYFIQVIFNADSAGSTSATPIDEDALFSEETGQVYVNFTSSGVRAGHVSGGVYKSTPYIACSTGANHVVQVWYDGTRIWIRLDGGTPQSIVAGAVDSLAGHILIGANQSLGAKFDGKIAQVLLMQSPGTYSSRISLRALAESDYATVTHAAAVGNPGGDYDDPSNWIADAVFFPSGGEEPTS
jgi:hypothetical protein